MIKFYQAGEELYYLHELSSVIDTSTQEVIDHIVQWLLSSFRKPLHT